MLFRSNCETFSINGNIGPAFSGDTAHFITAEQQQ